MLRFEQIKHTYTGAGLESRTVLDIPIWAIPGGSQILLRGVSGSGKTTLFNIAAGLLRPTQGEVMLDGIALYALSEPARDRLRAAKIGYVFQTHHLMPGFTALENVIMPMMFAAALPMADRPKRAAHLLEQVGLAAFGHHKPHQLSTGQRLRVGIARALANRPALLLADEPTASLDAASAESVMNLLQESCTETNATLIVASHDPALATRFLSVVDLRAGQLSTTEAIPA